MSVLVPPTTEYRDSFVAALREFHAEERNADLDAARLATPEGFTAYVAQLHAYAVAGPHLPDGWVAGTTLWCVEDDEFIGTVQIRHELTPALRMVGGHIGYEVRPSARGRGHATRMLALALPVAHDLGIDPALVTCDSTNVASRKVIEANGGRPDTPTGVKLRYWVATA